MKALVKETLQAFLEVEMDATVGAGSSQRSEGRIGYRSGYYMRNLTTRVGVIELRVPRDRDGLFSTELFERYQRSEKALVVALAEMYIQGVSTRKVAHITEELLGAEISASTVSACSKRLDEALGEFAHRTLDQEYPYILLDARYEKIREGGVVRSQAFMVALGIDNSGHRAVLAAECAPRESEETWTQFLEGLVKRGLHGVKLTISDDHPGLRKSIPKIMGGLWQRCYVHFLRNAISHAPKTCDPQCIDELKRIYNEPSLTTARAALNQWIAAWQNSVPSLVQFVEDSIDETLTYFAFPASHRKHIRSTNMLERLNEELKRRSKVVRIFPNQASCERLLRAVCSEIHEQWMDDQPYLTMSLLESWSFPPISQVA
jgi:transposase-like protein